jgi:hypothetical protein
MGVLPNFRSVSAGANVPPETPRERFIAATEDNYDYTSLFFAGWIAADAFATKATPEFHQGAAGFGRYYWHTVADQSVENYFVEFIIPTMTHEDSRYFAIGKEGGGPMKRLEYSVSRVVVARTESGIGRGGFGLQLLLPHPRTERAHDTAQLGARRIVRRGKFYLPRVLA